MEVWDPFGTLVATLWIGGGQWAGKSTVARLLAREYGVTAYHYDYQNARAHEDRLVANEARAGRLPDPPHADAVWVDPTPEEMAARVLAGFPERFQWTLDDLRGLVSGRPIVAEGWGLRPELVWPLLDSPRRMVVMVPTEEFRRHQERVLPRASTISHPVTDQERARRNRFHRDGLIAEDAVRSARELGIRVIEVDGSLAAAEVAAIVAEHFQPYLREPVNVLIGQ